jgi:polyisoprenoid-binding protein YceI
MSKWYTTGGYCMAKRLILVLVIAITVAAGIQAADSTTAPAWRIDKAHSRIGFDVTHLVISTVEGRFLDYDAELDFYPDNLEKSSAKVTIQTASITTDNERRDNHLKSPDFFDVEEYPTLTFVSKKVTKTGDKTFTLTGDLTIRGVTKEVTLDGSMKGPITGPWGGEHVGFSLEGTINRQDFGVSWSKSLDSGGLVAGDEVTLEIELELAKPAEG